MHNINFTVENFRFFDSQKLKPTKPMVLEGTVRVYEFEFYNEDCSGGHYLDGEYYPVKKGTCFFAKPGQRLKIILPYKCVFFNIITQDPALIQMLDGLPAFFPFLDVDEVMRIMQNMVLLTGRESLGAQLNLQSYASRILSLVSRYSNSGLFQKSLPLRRQRTLLMLEGYIKSHLSEDLSLKALANVCNLDATYLHKLYTKAFGQTLANRVQMHRINAAKRELLASEISMETVAANCGFSSQAYFCYCFKRATGKTPTQYRNDQLGADGRYHQLENSENL